jgi:DNA polymerase III delta prime subunit
MKQTIIRFLLCAVVALFSLNAGAQVKAFEKYADMKDVSYIYISKYMLAMAGKNNTPSIPNVDIKALSNKLSGIQIIHSDEGSACRKLKNDIKAILARDKYEVLMQMNDDDQKVNIYFTKNKEQSIVLMQVDEDDDEITLMVFSGKFSVEDVMKMTEND